MPWSGMIGRLFTDQRRAMDLYVSDEDEPVRVKIEGVLPRGLSDLMGKLHWRQRPVLTRCFWMEAKSTDRTK